MNVRDLLVRTGDLVSVRGLVLHADGQVWCEPVLPSHGPTRSGNNGKATQRSPHAIALLGDLDAVLREVDGSGHERPAQIEGVWAEEQTISVDSITACALAPLHPPAKDAGTGGQSRRARHRTVAGPAVRQTEISSSTPGSYPTAAPQPR